MGSDWASEKEHFLLPFLHIEINMAQNDSQGTYWTHRQKKYGWFSLRFQKEVYLQETKASSHNRGNLTKHKPRKHKHSKQSLRNHQKSVGDFGKFWRKHKNRVLHFLSFYLNKQNIGFFPQIFAQEESCANAQKIPQSSPMLHYTMHKIKARPTQLIWLLCYYATKINSIWRNIF